MCVSIATTDASHSATIHLLAEALKAFTLTCFFPPYSLYLSLGMYPFFPDCLNLVIRFGLSPVPPYLIVGRSKRVPTDEDPALRGKL